MTAGVWGRLAGLLVLAAAILVGLWRAEDELLRRQRVRAQHAVTLRDLARDEYVTAAHVRGPGAGALVGRLVTTPRRQGEVVGAGDVRPAPADQRVAALGLPPERSLGEALAIGLCVDVWSPAKGEPVARDLRVVTILPFAPGGQRLVFLALPPAAAGAVLAAKDPAVSIGRCPGGS